MRRSRSLAMLALEAWRSAPVAPRAMRLPLASVSAETAVCIRERLRVAAVLDGS